MKRPVLTAEGRERLGARVEKLHDVVLPELAVALGDRHRDPAVLLDYERAIAEAHRLSALLASAVELEALPDDPCVVEIGDLVTLEIDTGEIERFRVVDPAEAALDDVRISAESPLARALLGQRVGVEVAVVSPGGGYCCRILGATRPPLG